MSPSVVPLLGVIGILLAVTIGVARKSTEDLKARHEAEVNVAMLETRMDVARQLHLGAIDSLTRLIALAHEVSPELESEARQASLRLRELLNSLSSGKRTTSPLDLVAEVKEGISALRKSGMTVHSRLGRNRCPVDPSVAFLARELLTNALKYGASEVRIELERHGEDAMLLIANDFRNSDTETVDASRSSGFGLEHIGGLAAASGARLHIYEFGETMTCVLECSTVASLKKENDRDFAPGS